LGYTSWKEIKTKAARQLTAVSRGERAKVQTSCKKKKRFGD
jgi:predicted phage gp36 major capsid-like protein